jgi:hypothetical protein
MAVEMLEEPVTLRYPVECATRKMPVSDTTEIEPNFGADDFHAIKVIAYMMIAIFLYAFVVYGVITLFAWLG